jgi:hypothetical protein
MLIVPITRKDGSVVVAFVLTPKVLARLAQGEPQIAQATDLQKILANHNPFLPRMPIGIIDLVIHVEPDEDAFVQWVLDHPQGEDTIRRIADAHRPHPEDGDTQIHNLLGLLRTSITEFKQ